ncbi:MAG: hypothetical protein RLZZ135_900 [Cyanobacteriota bacterium]|jgi:hypothetical protein
MKSQWECVLENLGEWLGSFTTVNPQGELIADVSSSISLEGVRDNQAIHLVLKRFYAVPGSTETSTKEIVWNFSSPPGIGAIYFETGAFSSGGLTIAKGREFVAEFSLVGINRRFRAIQQYNPEHQFDRITFVREYRQGTDAPEHPQLTIADLLGTWEGTATTLGPDNSTPIVNQNTAKFSVRDDRYQWTENANSIDLQVINDRLLQFDLEHQSYQILLLPDSGYSLTPTHIVSGYPCYLEIGWIRSGELQRLLRRYDGTGRWNATFITQSKQP